MKRGDTLRVVDDSTSKAVGAGRKPPFRKDQEVVVTATLLGPPDGSVALRGFHGYWSMTRFRAVSR